MPFLSVGGQGAVRPHATRPGVLCKPLRDARGAAELAHYCHVFAPARCALPPATFMPRYLGSLLPAPSSELCMEDLTAGLACPCVMDVKMGAQSWDGAAGPEKRAREAAKWPAQARLGLRFTGMAMRSLSGEALLLDRAYCHGLPCEGDAGPRQALGSFLADGRGGLRAAVAAAFLARLEEILAWFTVQCEFRFYASSLLLVYEGGSPAAGGGATGGAAAATPTPSTAAAAAAAASVHMIDFAHVEAVQEGPAARDEGYMLGLRTLIRCLQGMLMEAAPAPAALPT